MPNPPQALSKAPSASHTKAQLQSSDCRNRNGDLWHFPAANSDTYFLPWQPLPNFPNKVCYWGSVKVDPSCFWTTESHTHTKTSVGQVTVWSQNFSSAFAGDDGEDKTPLLRQRELNADNPILPATAPKETWCKAKAAYLQTWYWHCSILSLVLHMCLRPSREAQKRMGSRKGEGRENVHYQNTLRAVLGNVQPVSLYQTLISCEGYTGLFISPLKRTKIRGQL